MIHYYLEKLILNIALFFLSLSRLGKLDKYNVKQPTTVINYYTEWIKEYLKNFKEEIENYEE